MARGENQLYRSWCKLCRWPGGKRLFSFLLGRKARYTGSIAPRVRELRPGFARVEMKDRPKVRNHLRSIHAIALMNLAEVTSGLAMLSGLDPAARAILTGLSITYEKKARGWLTAESTAQVPETTERQEYDLEAVIRDRSGDVVARATARWLVGPK